MIIRTTDNSLRTKIEYLKVGDVFQYGKNIGMVVDFDEHSNFNEENRERISYVLLKNGKIKTIKAGVDVIVMRATLDAAAKKTTKVLDDDEKLIEKEGVMTY